MKKSAAEVFKMVSEGKMSKEEFLEWFSDELVEAQREGEFQESFSQL